MSWAIIEELAFQTACPYCRAAPGGRCVTISGARSTYMHSARSARSRIAYWQGYNDGRGDAMDTSIDRPDIFERQVALHQSKRSDQ